MRRSAPHRVAHLRVHHRACVVIPIYKMFTVARCNAWEREHISFAFPDAVVRVCSECRLNMMTTTEDVFVMSHADLLSHGAQVVQAVVEQFPVGMLTSKDLVNASYIVYCYIDHTIVYCCIHYLIVYCCIDSLIVYCCIDSRNVYWCIGYRIV